MMGKFSILIFMKLDWFQKQLHYLENVILRSKVISVIFVVSIFGLCSILKCKKCKQKSAC